MQNKVTILNESNECYFNSQSNRLYTPTSVRTVKVDGRNFQTNYQSKIETLVMMNLGQKTAVFGDKKIPSKFDKVDLKPLWFHEN